MSTTPRPDRRPERKGRRTLKTATLDQVNQGILDVARESFDEEQSWEFFCECGQEDCEEYVSLALDAYVALRDGGGAVLAPGHRLSQTERARRLREEADALKRQAQHQLERVKRNLHDDGGAAG